MKLKGAQIIVETLIEQGATTVFGYPGGQVIDIYDALYLAQDRIHHIITAHEQGAAHAADGYARATVTSISSPSSIISWISFLPMLTTACSTLSFEQLQ